MIKQKTFDKIFFVYRYLRDSLIKPARVDLSDNSFVILFIKEFNAKHDENLYGIKFCDELEPLLNLMCSKLILQRTKIALNPWNQTRKTVWSYSLTEYADTIISNYQDYFLNQMIKKSRLR